MRLSRFLFPVCALILAVTASLRADNPACDGATHSCFEVDLTEKGCSSADCCKVVCTIDPACCDAGWDELCVAVALKFCSTCGNVDQSCFAVSTSPGCNTPECCGYICAQPGFEYCCEIEWDVACVIFAKDVCAGCGEPGVGSCSVTHDAPGCADNDCCIAVCQVDPACCELGWDQSCVQWTQYLCPGCGGPTSGGCCYAHPSPYCDDGVCCETVCASDPFCCDNYWDSNCVALANAVCDIEICCGDPGGGNCKAVHATPGCSDAECCNNVCFVDSYCCEVSWDYACTQAANQLCAINPACGTIGSGSCFVRHPTPGCDNAGCCQRVCNFDPLCCQIEWDQDCADLADKICTDCGDTLAGSCFAAHGGPACNDLECCETVCAIDPFCCEGSWDGVCATFALAKCEAPISACGANFGRSCYIPSYLPGCDDAGCCVQICAAIDPYCCEVRWDAVCADHALSTCGAVGGCPGRGNCLIEHSFKGCNDALCCSAVCQIDPICCQLGWDQYCVGYAQAICFGLDDCPGDKPCTESHGSPGCEDPACCNVVCSIDPLCCIEAWDVNCATLAKGRCQPAAGSNCPCIGSCNKAHENPGCEDAACCAGVCILDPTCCELSWDEGCVVLARQVCCGDIGCGNWCAGSCFAAHGSPFCSSASCCEAVCSIDPFCCASQWDVLCADLAESRCSSLCGLVGSGNCFEAHLTPSCQDRDCCDAVCAVDPICCQQVWDGACVLLAKGDPGDPRARPPVPATKGLCEVPECGDFSAGPCCEAHDTPACNDPACCQSVCATDPFCCDTEWDATCAGEARSNNACNCVSECGDPCAGSCCEPHLTPLCDDEKCCEAVCLVDPFCCQLDGGVWDNICVEIVQTAPECEDPCPSPPCGAPGAGDCCSPHASANCNDLECCEKICNFDPFCCDVQWDFTCAIEAGDACLVCMSKFFCGSPASGSCFKPHSTPYCDDIGCCGILCTIDETCCTDSWDETCANLALQFCAP